MFASSHDPDELTVDLGIYCEGDDDESYQHPERMYYIFEIKISYEQPEDLIEATFNTINQQPHFCCKVGNQVFDGLSEKQFKNLFKELDIGSEFTKIQQFYPIFALFSQMTVKKELSLQLKSGFSQTTTARNGLDFVERISPMITNCERVTVYGECNHDPIFDQACQQAQMEIQEPTVEISRKVHDLDKTNKMRFFILLGLLLVFLLGLILCLILLFIFHRDTVDLNGRLATKVDEINTTLKNYTRRPCEPHWKQMGDFCYYVSWSEVLHTNAESECKKMNSHLASIHNDDENHFIYMLLKKYDLLGIIGLVRTNGSGDHSNGTWKWTDGSDTHYSNWKYFSPEQLALKDWVMINSEDGRWSNFSPEFLHPICKKQAFITKSLT
ncbi:unnamed protein product, partial [Mesorhabditis belari]|uniref:C-type lectin domain-containing protein n=1 Tax=Mesorhabditis belari TaxID=2138241 RepID=A0AAF3JAH8_9BILA